MALKNHRLTIALDFDGVIHKYSKGFHDGTAYDEPVPGVFEAIEKLLLHYNVFIHSTRDPKEISDWLQEHEAPFDWVIYEARHYLEVYWDEEGVVGITNKKLVAFAYVDDRGVRFTNWKDIQKRFC